MILDQGRCRQRRVEFLDPPLVTGIRLDRAENLVDRVCNDLVVDRVVELRERNDGTRECRVRGLESAPSGWNAFE
ncbi:hypothetical protein C479_09895 [Halovivax asiaticus JCM 14624]|uniref:Uncharacterized protein n=1 Tax=Halovivax asiaticus JCM 14624 TaxID=1227490 RepID=M0BGX7_9EURY|nr:hypothetical protein [Halovivax asiaticus]ELZ10100.1 hypothetical protein C479_09895 [Halovivax asiaticus JCM 14624]